MIDKIISDQVGEISKKYKVSSEQLTILLQDYFKKFPGIIDKWNNTNSIKNIYRTAEYKKLIKNFRKELYYLLRTYQKPGDDICSHLSSRERQPYIHSFIIKVDKAFKECASIIDIGGGLFPMQFPFEKYKKLNYYVWLDKDTKSYNKLLTFKDMSNIETLHLYNHKIGEKPWNFYLQKGQNEFDLAIMLKLIPVVERQEKELLQILSEIPAKRFLITGSKEAMVKKRSIHKREAAVIKSFIDKLNTTVTLSFEIENEFGYLLEKVS